MNRMWVHRGREKEHRSRQRAKTLQHELQSVGRACTDTSKTRTESESKKEQVSSKEEGKDKQALVVTPFC